EPAGAARGARDASLTGAAKGARRAVGARHDGDGDVARGALLVRHVPERLEQPPGAPGVVEAGAAVTRRVDPGLAAERVDLDARMVGGGGGARGARVVAGLAGAVPLVGRAGLLVRLADAGVCEGAHRVSRRLDESRQLARLARVERRDQERRRACRG